MTRTLCVALLILVTFAAGPALAADEEPTDPTVQLYTTVLEQLKERPDSLVALLALQPPANTKDTAPRAALDRILACLEGAAAQNTRNFETAHNLYLALWKRHLYYANDADARRALAQLDAAQRIAAPRSEEKTRCVFERAGNLLALKKELATELAGGDPRDEAAKLFVEAKLRAMSKGNYARRSALALAGLYTEKGRPETARTYLREALKLDTRRGWTTNCAYDRLGRLLLDAGKTDDAVTMIESAANVEFDDDLKTEGYAWRLARKLVDAGGSTYCTKAVEYLQAAYAAARKHQGVVAPDLLYALALGCEKLKRSELAILYWQRYLALRDPNTAQRLDGERRAKALVVKTVKTPNR